MGYWKNGKRELEKGQILLIVVLVMVVALTIGLSLVARSITNLRNAGEQVASDKALSAAEAGIERVLKSQAPIANEQLDATTSIKQVTIDTNYGRNVFVVNNGNPLPKDEGIDIWLSTFPNYTPPLFTGKLQVYWGNSAACADAAVEIVVFSGTTNSPVLGRYEVDPCNTRGNNFSAPNGTGGTVGGKSYNFSTVIPPTGVITNGLFARITPFYAGTPVAIVGADSSGNPQLLPQQGELITSIGVAGNTERKISYYQGHDELPSEFFYSLFQTQ